MGYRPIPTIRKSPRRRTERTKPKGGNKRSRLPRGPEQEEMMNSTQVLEKTIDALRNLGNQKFALPPFDEHFKRWFQTLQTILSDLSAHPTAALDDQFLEEGNKILSDLESTIRERRMKEASSRETAVARLDSENRLLQIEREHEKNEKLLEAHEKEAIDPLTKSIQSLKEQGESLARIKTGFFRGISKEEKSRRESEVRLRLDAIENELKVLTQSFEDRRAALEKKHEQERAEILTYLNPQRREAESHEVSSDVDTTADTRRTACDTLITAIQALVERNIRT